MTPNRSPRYQQAFKNKVTPMPRIGQRTNVAPLPKPKDLPNLQIKPGIRPQQNTGFLKKK